MAGAEIAGFSIRSFLHQRETEWVMKGNGRRDMVGEGWQDIIMKRHYLRMVHEERSSRTERTAAQARWAAFSGRLHDRESWEASWRERLAGEGRELDGSRPR